MRILPLGPRWSFLGGRKRMRGVPKWARDAIATHPLGASVGLPRVQETCEGCAEMGAGTP